MRFTPGNTIGRGRPKGSPNKVNKEALIELMNSCVTDLQAKFETLNTYQKIKIITAFKDIYRDALTEGQIADEPRVFNINIVHPTDEPTENYLQAPNR